MGPPATNGLVSVEGKDGLALVQLHAFDTEAVISAGGKNGRPGRLTMVDGNGNKTVELTTYLGGNLWMLDGKGNQTVNLSALALSGGNLSMLDGKGNQAVSLSANGASLALGGLDKGGTVTVSGKDGQPLVQLLAHDTEAVIGAGQTPGRAGRLTMYDGKQPIQTVNLTAVDATLKLGGAGTDGTVTLRDGKDNNSINLDAKTGNISVRGDVTLTGSDCAEQFDMHDATSAEPGTIVVIDDEGRLRESQCAYDKRVAGVVSGAGEYRPAIVLDKQASSEGRASVALVGKVYCKVDADPAPITVGDLLTTSGRPGFAMKATDSAHAFGAVIGKALRPLRAGQGMIPILVALQ